MAKSERQSALMGLLVSGMVVALAGAGGIIATAYMQQDAMRAADAVAPSERARIIAAGISESMNGVLLGGAIAVLALVPTIYFAVRLARASKV